MPPSAARLGTYLRSVIAHVARVPGTQTLRSRGTTVRDFADEMWLSSGRAWRLDSRHGRKTVTSKGLALNPLCTATYRALSSPSNNANSEYGRDASRVLVIPDANLIGEPLPRHQFLSIWTPSQDDSLINYDQRAAGPRCGGRPDVDIARRPTLIQLRPRSRVLGRSGSAS